VWIAIGSVALASCDPGTEPPRVASVAVTPSATTLRSLGETVELTAVARDGDGKAIPGKTFVWATSDEGVARLGSTPIVTAVANGRATITATTDGLSGTATIQVEQTLAKLEVTPASSVLTSVGETLQLTATPKDARDNPISTERNATWRSSATAVARVDDRGLVTAERDGLATMTATLDGVAGSAAVQVSQRSVSLRFVLQPTTTQVGVSITEVRVGLEDARGQAVASASDAVTLSLAPNAAGGTLSGGRAISAVAGVASFSTLVIDRAGAGYRLVATSGNLAAATSSPFDVITTPARFDSLKLNSTTVAIEGLAVGYTAWLANASGRTMRQAGVQGWIEQGSARRAAGGTLVGTNCGGSVGTMAPGTCRLFSRLSASNRAEINGTGTLVPGPATARFDLFEASAIHETLRIPITLETFVPPPTPAASIDNVTLSSNTVRIEGPSVAYTAALSNASGSDISTVFVRAYITQGSTSRAAAGAAVRCGAAEPGVLPPGSCDFNFGLIASNSTGGSGVLVPGPATARFELHWDYGIIATYEVAISLVN
jgi:hypothetical protein